MAVETLRKNALYLVLIAFAFMCPMRPDASWGQVQPQSGIGDPTQFIASHPLRPPELDSPRATLMSFITYANTAIDLWRNEGSRENIRLFLRRAWLCLDLSDIPVATRNALGTEKVMLLKEILDRIELPQYDEIPDAAMVRESGLQEWTIPNTEITISLVQEGARAGVFLFNKRTVSLLNDFFQLVEPLPYKSGATVGVYEDYIYGPGKLIPRNWVDELPAWSHEIVGDQTVWQWAALALVAAILGCVIYGIFQLGRWWDTKLAGVSVWLRVGELMTSALVILTIPIMSLVVDDVINITGVAFVVVEFVISAIGYVAAAWLAVLIVSRVSEGIIHSRRLRSGGLNSQLIRIVSRLISLIIIIYIGIVAAESFGIPVTPLIAGLGVGGLAIALAVRPTLENIVGGFILFADKPVRVGDFCSFGEMTGTVEEIGLRSTRIRALDRTLITVPNAEFANMQLINWASCDTMLILTRIGLRYETKPDQLRYVLAKLREMFFSHPKIEQETLRIRFVGYGESSQDIEIRAYAISRDWNEYFAIQEDVLIRVGEIVDASGTRFAFPSQTLYLARDKGLDEDRSAAAMDQVSTWRKKGQLPFPRMATDYLKRLANTLDYPPHGSAEAARPYAFEAGAAEPLSNVPPASEGEEEEEDEERRS